jgi:hypothetical protein
MTLSSTNAIDQATPAFEKHEVRSLSWLSGGLVIQEVCGRYKLSLLWWRD